MVGGTSLAGGIGGVQRTLIGVAIITVLNNGLNLMGMGPYWQLVIKGLVVIGAVLISQDRSRGAHREIGRSQHHRRRAAQSEYGYEGRRREMVAKQDFTGSVSYDFSGKTVVIYGGTTGIGRATAKDFAKAGANVFVSGLGEADGKSLVEEIKAAGNPNVDFIEADVTREKDIQDVMARDHQEVRTHPLRVQQCRRLRSEQADARDDRRRVPNAPRHQSEGRVSRHEA